MFKCSTVHPDCQYTAATGKQWKIHAARAHGGWKDAQWIAVSRAASEPAGASFAQAPPVSETQQAQTPANPSPSAAPALPFAEMREKFAEALALVAWAPLQNYFGAPKLSEGDTKTITEGFTAALSIFNIQPEFKPIEKKLTNPLWAFMFPIITILIVLTKKVSIDEILRKLSETQNKKDRRNDRPAGPGKDDPGRGLDPGTAPRGSV